MKFNAKFWQKADDAREELESQLDDRSDVCYVDVGFPQDQDDSSKEISLRIHVCDESDSADQKDFPKDVDGIPVVVSPKRKS